MRSIVAAVMAVTVAGLAACGQMEPRQPVAKLKDGELALPADYKTWSKLLSGIQRPDAKQVRQVYVNARGQSATEGGSFPEGTIFIMENYKAKLDVDGTPVKGADGKLVKGELARVFVMGKGAGWVKVLRRASRTATESTRPMIPAG